MRYSVFSKPFIVISFSLFLFSSILSPALAETALCRSVELLEINETVRARHVEPDGAVAFAIDIPSTGYLAIAAVSSGGANDPRLTFLGSACSSGKGHETFRHLERSAHALVLELSSAGTYFLKADFAASEEPAVDYKLTARFVERHAAIFDAHQLAFRATDSLNDGEGGSDEWDNEILPPPTPNPQPVIEPNDGEGGSDEWDNEILPPPTPNPQPVIEPNDGEGGSDEWDNEILPPPTPNPQPVIEPNGGEQETSWCDVYGREDDHSDSALCASVLTPTRRLFGELAGDWQDDSDTFTFELREASTVRLETLGTTDTLGRLFDRFGHQLAHADRGGHGENFAIDIYLGPGRYFLRVAGAHFSEGAYEVVLTPTSSFDE